MQRSQLASLLFIVILAVAGLGATVGLGYAPKLGLDLVGGTTLTLVAKPAPGQNISKDNLDTARDIIEKRVNGYGVTEATVEEAGSDTIIVSVPGKNNEDIRQVGTPAQMRFRKVLNATTDKPAVAAPATSGTSTTTGGCGWRAGWSTSSRPPTGRSPRSGSSSGSRPSTPWPRPRSWGSVRPAPSRSWSSSSRPKTRRAR